MIAIIIEILLYYYSSYDIVRLTIFQGCTNCELANTNTTPLSCGSLYTICICKYVENISYIKII